MTEHLTGIVDSITALSKQRDAANEEIRRLRDLCREAHYTLYLEMAGGWEPPRG